MKGLVRIDMMTPASGEIANQYDTLSPVGCEKERNMAKVEERNALPIPYK